MNPINSTDKTIAEPRYLSDVEENSVNNLWFCATPCQASHHVVSIFAFILRQTNFAILYLYSGNVSDINKTFESKWFLCVNLLNKEDGTEIQ